MKTVKFSFAVALFLTTTISFAQERNSAAQHEQIKRSIQIVENILNTVRQQSINSVMLAAAKATDPSNPVLFYLRNEGNRSEGTYLEGYGVIFEVPVPNFVERRSFSMVLNRIFPEQAGPKTVRTTPNTPRAPSAARVVVENKANDTAAMMNNLSKLIDTYTVETQSKDKQVALQDLFAKLRETFSARQTGGFEPPFLPANQVTTTVETSDTIGSKANEQRQKVQDSIVRAVADYGSSIPGLQPNQFVTVFLKSQVPEDFSVCSPETRISTIIRFAVKDLHEYKVGKISYTDLLSRVKVEEN